MSTNVLVTVASLNPSTGGPARSVPRLSEAIDRAGAIVQLFVNNNEGRALFHSNLSTAFSDADFSPLTFLPVKEIDNLGAAVEENRKKFPKSTLIHNHGIWLPINHTASITASRYNIPLIISPRGMLEPWARSYRSWKKTLAWYLYQRRNLKVASVLHATSEGEARNLQTLGLNVPIAIIPNGIDLPELSKQESGITHKKTALFLSRIHPVKGLVNLVSAWSKIRPVDWEVVIAGPNEGGHQAVVEKEIQKHELTDSFHFVGPVDDTKKWELYSRADLFILPTYSENFGIVVAEALASCLPVITTKGTPWSELEEYECGWWIDIGVEPLAKALEDAMNLSQEERHVMGQRGRKLVEEHFTWPTIAVQMCAVYAWVLGQGQRPDCVITD